jgi:ferredoxin-NADP reductase
MVTSYPVAFLGFFMLTEPLTLPIRKYQRVIVATVVALLVALPFQVPTGDGSSFSSSPELALVVGNLVAWGLVAGSRHRRATGFTLDNTRSLANQVTEFTLSLDTPLPLLPGQWVEIHLPHRRSDGRGSRRVFSISSDPARAVGDTPQLTITTRQATGRGSSFKADMFTLSEGARGRITRVGGEFLPPSSSQPVICVAGGIGITPFLSWLSARRDDDSLPPVLVVLVARDHDEGLVEGLEGPGVSVVVVPTSSELEAALEDWGVPVLEAHVAVSGSPRFVRLAKKTLRSMGQRTVKTDLFLGY